MPENLLYSYNINFSKDSSSSNDEFLGTASFSFYSGTPDTDIHVGDELNNWLSQLIVPNRFIRQDMIEGRRLHGEYNDCIFIKKRRNTPSFSYGDISRNKVSV